VTERRFAPPWSVEELNAHACFVVRDDSGQKLAYVYLLSAKLPELLQKP
jgi:hypothetical protein